MFFGDFAYHGPFLAAVHKVGATLLTTLITPKACESQAVVWHPEHEAQACTGRRLCPDP